VVERAGRRLQGARYDGKALPEMPPLSMTTPVTLEDATFP
jgi:hypothetical protein